MRGVHANVIRFLRFDPFNPRRFLFTSFDSLFEARNGGGTFTPLPLPRSGFLRAIQFDPFERGRIVAVTRERGGENPPVDRLFESRDGGRHWGAPASVPEGTVDLAIAAPQALLAAAGNRIYLRHADGVWHRRIQVEPSDGVGWFDFSRLVAEPTRPEVVLAIGVDNFAHGGTTLYATTDGRGVLVSHDGARTWSPLRSGLPLDGRLPITDLEQDPVNPDRLYATPSTGGLWRLDL